MHLFPACYLTEREFKMTQTQNIIVCLGPSLSRTDAQKKLPDATYLPPVRCGDILRILRLKPTLIAIIDGYFEHTAAVWHKEILYAMEQGVMVAGSSSMGALRAAELVQYGMMGVGKIFEDYAHNKIIDDDEVAVLHQSSEYDYVSLTDAMVNIRATMVAAVKQAVISHIEGDNVIQAAKCLPYRERTFAQAMIAANLNQQSANNLKSWLAKKNYVDQKKQDAIKLLEKIADNSIFQYQQKNYFASPTPKAAFFRALHRNMMCKPFPSHQSWLPLQEKVALMARYLGRNYKLLKRLAYLMSTIYACVHKYQINPSAEQISITENNFVMQAKNDWCKTHDCTPEEKTDFIYRISSIQALFTLTLKSQTATHTPDDYFLMFLKFHRFYKAYKNSTPNDPHTQSYALLKQMAELWWIIDVEITAQGIFPNEQSLQEYSNQFRHRNNLLSQKSTEEWFIQNDLDLYSYQQMITTAANFSFLILQNNTDVLDIPHVQTQVWWLRDALWLTGFYQTAKELVFDKSLLEKIKIAEMQNTSDLDQHAYALDFTAGKIDFMGVEEDAR